MAEACTAPISNYRYISPITSQLAAKMLCNTNIYALRALILLTTIPAVHVSIGSLKIEPGRSTVNLTVLSGGGNAAFSNASVSHSMYRGYVLSVSHSVPQVCVLLLGAFGSVTSVLCTIDLLILLASFTGYAVRRHRG